MSDVDNGPLLIIEDNEADMMHYLRILEDVPHGFSSIECRSNFSEGLSALQEIHPKCCLLDYNLPGGNALALLNKLKEMDEAPCPIIVITGQEDTATAVELLRKGAQDYLIKQQIDAYQLIHVIESAMKTWDLQQQLNHLALHDYLTGLVNRALFVDRLSQMFAESKRYMRHFALLYIDLDHFKHVNDTYGHDAGDFLLKAVANKFKLVLRSTDTAARLGGDEFAVLLPNISEAKAHNVAFKLVEVLNCQVSWGETTLLPLSTSIGLTYSNTHTHVQTHADLMREADLALYRSKANGRGRYSAYNEKMDERSRFTKRLSEALPQALSDLQLKIAYQPIVNLHSGQVESVEALTRWSFEGDWVSPETIVYLILELGLSHLFHDWLFTNSLKQLKLWQETHPSLKLSLNLPSNLCHDSKIIQQLLEAIKTLKVSPSDITVEVTEAHLMVLPDKSRLQLQALADSNIQIAIDDFGVGYSSMQYLGGLPCATLKIDKSFFLALLGSKLDCQIISAISSLAHSLGMKVIAEGIENEDMLKVAHEVDCDLVQGYLLGAPVFGDNNLFSDYLQASKDKGFKLCDTEKLPNDEGMQKA